MQVDVSPLAATPALPPLPPILSLDIAGFTSMIDPNNGGQTCWQGSSAGAVGRCQTFCNNLTTAMTQMSGSTFTNMDFYRLTTSLSTPQWCDALASPSAPTNVTPITPLSASTSSGIYVDASGTPTGASCSVRFSLPTFSGTGNPANYYVGYRRKSSSFASLPDVYSDLRSHTALAANQPDRGLQIGAFTVQ